MRFVKLRPGNLNYAFIIPQHPRARSPNSTRTHTSRGIRRLARGWGVDLDVAVAALAVPHAHVTGAVAKERVVLCELCGAPLVGDRAVDGLGANAAHLHRLQLERNYRRRRFGHRRVPGDQRRQRRDQGQGRHYAGGVSAVRFWGLSVFRQPTQIYRWGYPCCAWLFWFISTRPALRLYNTTPRPAHGPGLAAGSGLRAGVLRVVWVPCVVVASLEPLLTALPN